MAYVRKEIGAVLKSKDPSQQDYIKIKEDVTLKQGETLSLESKKSRLAGLDKAVESGKLAEEVANKIRENVEKMPDYIRFNIVKVTKD